MPPKILLYRMIPLFWLPFQPVERSAPLQTLDTMRRARLY